MDIDEFRFWVRDGSIIQMYLSYTPRAADERLEWLRGAITSFPTEWQPQVAERFARLIQIVTTKVPQRQIQMDDQILNVRPQAEALGGYPKLGRFRIWFEAGNEDRSVADLSPQQIRLYDSVLLSFSSMAWKHLRKRLAVPPTPASGAPQVLISYRRGHEDFAEALGRRLGDEGLIPWLDKWDVRAGDSLPGKIEKAFREPIALIPIITADYQQGSWATEELRTAIVKRIEEGFRIVPVMLERCQIPELIQQLVYVDMTDHNPETFDAKTTEIVDGIFGLELNPFRRE